MHRIHRIIRQIECTFHKPGLRDDLLPFLLNSPENRDYQTRQEIWDALDFDPEIILAAREWLNIPEEDEL